MEVRKRLVDGFKKQRNVEKGTLILQELTINDWNSLKAGSSIKNKDILI